MARWQPPIPADMLYSAPARKLGAGIVLLLWCYDAVQRETGTVNISLTEAADALDESYHTVKKWWHALRVGPFFSEIRDCGRKGFEATFHDEWVDWRQMSGKSPVKDSSRPTQVPETVLEDEQNIAQGALKDSSRTSEVPEMVFDDNAYKVLHDDQKKHARSSRKRSDVRSSDEESNEPLSVEKTPQDIRRALYDACQIADTASREVKLNANSAAKRFWQAGARQGKSNQEIADAIRSVGSWCRKGGAWQCKDGSAPTPKLIGDYWRQAIEARDKAQTRAPPALNGTNGTHPPESTLTREQLKATFAGHTYVRPSEQS